MAKPSFLEFEQPIAELESKIEELRFVQDESAVDISEEIERLSKKNQQLTKDIYAKLTPWQIAQIARHPQRPYTLDYAAEIFTDFHELHGDRSFADDISIVGGLARFNGQACMVIGHQKGRDTKERALRNFGMPRPEGYRKALRLMQLAEKFRLPIFTFIDTPGAFPGIDAEERGQSEAIGHNLCVMAQLQVPIISTIIGEGGSGGALAIAVGDIVQMLQYATYSVISPEGCASILWKTAQRAADAADALGLTAHRLKAMGLIDKIVNEPLGGAHRDPKQMALLLKRALADALRQFQGVKPKDLTAARFERLMNYGKFKEITPANNSLLQALSAHIKNALEKLHAHFNFHAFSTAGAPLRIALAYSGGLDSSVLLHGLQQALAARANDAYSTHSSDDAIQLSAFHIQHGLSVHAADWQAHCAKQCAKLKIPFATASVKINPAGQGVEQAARLARYQALKELAIQHRIDVLLTAHHEDDQAETILLQLFRGAGMAGLSGMGEYQTTHSLLAPVALARPLLNMTRAQLEACASRHKISYIEDESNIDARYTRNALRHQIFPVLKKIAPHFQAGIVRSARHAQQAQQLLTELAQQDFESCRQGEDLCISECASFSAARIENLLRHWLKQRAVKIPSAARLTQIRMQIFHARDDAQIRIEHAGYALRRYRGVMSLQALKKIPAAIDFRWNVEESLDFPEFGGVLRFIPSASGLNPAWLQQQTLTLKARADSASRLKLATDRPSKSLKNIFQEKAIAAWRREEFPAVYVASDLIYVARIGMDVRYLQAEGIRFEWLGSE